MKTKFAKSSLCLVLVMLLVVSVFLPAASAIDDEALTEETVIIDTEPLEAPADEPAIEGEPAPAQEPEDEEPAEESEEITDVIADEPQDEQVEVEVEDAQPEEEAQAGTEAPKAALRKVTDLAASSAVYTVEVDATDPVITRSTIITAFGDRPTSLSYYGFAPASAPDDFTYTPIISLNPSYPVSAGDYIFYKTTSTISWINPNPNWSVATTVDTTIRTYYEASFSVSGHDEGEVYLNGTAVTGTERLYTDTQYTVTAKDIDDYTYSIAGATDGEEFTPSEELTVSVTYMRDEYATFTVSANDGGTVEVKSGDTVLGDKIPAGEGFDVIATPDTDNNYYVESIAITENGTPIDGSSVSSVGDGDVYEITVTFAQADLTLDDMEVNIVDIKNGAFGGIENQILGSATFVPASFSSDADISVQYLAATALGLEYYQDLDYSPALFAHAFGYSTAQGSLEAGNTETVRVTVTNPNYPGITLQATATATVADLRIPTEIVSTDVITVTYGDDLRRVITEAIDIVDEDGAPIDFSYDDIAVDPEAPDVSLLSTQQIEVTYGGNDTYMGSTGTVIVYVRQAEAELDVKSETITYGETPALEVITEPADLDYFRIIAGIDGDASGFLSLDIPQSLKDLMTFSILGFDVSVYDMITGAIGEGVSVGEFQNIINNISSMFAEGSLIAEAARAAGFDVDSLQAILGILDSIPTLDLNAKITLGNPPSNAGVYLVGAVSANLNYTIEADVAYLVILPKTTTEDDVIELRFKNDIPGLLNVMSYEDAQTFEFGGDLYENDTVIDNGHVGALYVGVRYDGSVVAQQSTPPTEPGVYTETVYVLGGNYFATPIVREYTVRRKDVELSMDDLTVTYNGEGHSTTATANYDTVDTDDIIYTYYGTNVFSNTPPVDAGTYLVTAVYPGDANHQPSTVSAFLIIVPRDVTVTIADKTKVYGDRDPRLTYTTEGVVRGERLDITLRRERGQDVGEYEITASLGRNRNYNITVIGEDGGAYGIFTITPRPITVTILDETKVYGEEDPELEYDVDDLVEGDTLDITLSREEGEDVGEYKITASLGVNPNYDITVVGSNAGETIVPTALSFDIAATGVDGEEEDPYGIFTITPRKIIIIVKDVTKTDGDDDPEPEIIITDEDGNALTPEEIGLVITREEGETPGRYKYSITFTNANYVLDEEASDIDATLTINAPESTTTDTAETVETNPAAPATGSLNVEILWFMLLLAVFAVVDAITRKRSSSK